MRKKSEEAVLQDLKAEANQNGMREGCTDAAIAQRMANSSANKQAQVTAPDATDLSTAITLVNELKAKMDASNA